MISLTAGQQLQPESKDCLLHMALSQRLAANSARLEANSANMANNVNNSTDRAKGYNLEGTNNNTLPMVTAA